MNETTLAELKQEVKALRLIVYSLVEQNEAIKAELRDLKQEIQSKITIDSNSSRPVESDSAIHSTSLQRIDTNSPIHSSSPQDMTSNSFNHSTSAQDIESNSFVRSTSLQDFTANSSIHNNLSEGCGTSENIEGDSFQRTPTDNSNPQLPLKLNVSNSNIYAISGRLRQAGFGGGKESPCVAAAKLFIYFYNEQPGEYKYLRKLTTYSEGGLGKLLMRLRAHGYLVKTGFQQHAITGKALELMQQAQCK